MPESIKLREAREVQSWSYDYTDTGRDTESYLELVEWQNGEGVDVNIERLIPDRSILQDKEHFSLSDSDASALVAALANRLVIPAKQAG